MNFCPRCQSSVADSPTCPQCGADLTLIRQAAALGDTVAHARRSLNERFAEIERKAGALQIEVVAQLQRQPMANAVPPAIPAVAAVATVAAPVVEEPKSQPSMSPVARPPLTSPPPPTKGAATIAAEVREESLLAETQFGQKWLLLIGIVIMLFGVAYFLKYSFERNWISPAVRVLMAYGVGATLLGVGEWFRRRHENFGLCLAGGGIAALYFSTFAGYQIYHLLPAALAFGIMIVITALAGAIALAYDAKWLAVLGLVGGFATPLLIDTGSHDHIALFSYLTVLNAGLLWIALHKQWRLLNYLGFFFTWALFSTWACGQSFRGEDTPFVSGLFFLQVFYLVYALAPFAALLRGKPDATLQGVGLSVPNSAIAFGFAYDMIQSHTDHVQWVSVATIAYAALQFGLAKLLQVRRPEKRDAMLVAQGQGLFFMGVTVPILFSNQWITIGWALEAVIVVWVAQRLRSGWLFAGGLILSILTLVRLVGCDYDRVGFVLDSFSFSHGYGYLMVARWVTDAVVLASLWLTGWILGREEDSFIAEQPTWAGFYYSAFGLLLFGLLNVEVAGFFHEAMPSAKFAAISVLWTLYSVGLIVLGFVKRLEGVRYTSFALFAITIGKVFFVDMANVATPYRIISCVVLGLMLIGASFLYYKFRDRLLPVEDSRAGEKNGGQ